MNIRSLPTQSTTVSGHKFGHRGYDDGSTTIHLSQSGINIERGVTPSFEMQALYCIAKCMGHQNAKYYIIYNISIMLKPAAPLRRNSTHIPIPSHPNIGLAATTVHNFLYLPNWFYLDGIVKLRF